MLVVSGWCAVSDEEAGLAVFAAFSGGESSPDADEVGDCDGVVEAVVADGTAVADGFRLVGGVSSFWEPEVGVVVSAGCVAHPFGWLVVERCVVSHW